MALIAESIYKTVVLLTALTCIPFSVLAEADYRQQYDAFLSTSRSDYVTFTEANERLYAKSLAQDWKSFSEAQQDPLPPEHKPKLQPSHKTQRGNGVSASIKPLASLENNSRDFYGHHLTRPPVADILPRLKGLEPSALLSFRRAFLQHSAFETLSQYAQFLTQRYTEGPWAAIQLLAANCELLYTFREDQQGCLWILGQQQGLDIRVARSVGGLELLIKSPQTWFDHPYFLLGEERFQLIEKSHYIALPNPRLQIHTQPHPQAVRGVRIRPSRGLRLAMRHTRSRVLGQQISISVDEDHARYLANLPILDITDYLDDSLPDYLAEQLQAPLLASLSGLTPQAQIEQLLKWLQALPYQIDEEQFGREKPMTLTELLYFDASDCEDRVYALAVIARRLLGIDVAALKFPGHLSAAVKLAGKWQEADPTYVGAGLNERQPVYWNIEPNWYY
ncbi:hypothetical protein [Zhongshania sp.]|uniref:hypothetical protein n=1 Tax=Zhongshania sp. TaxID=1971902 RepID=UPI0035679732